MNKRISLDIDERLLCALDRLAAREQQSRNQMLNTVIRRALRELERERVSREFEAMAQDTRYCEEMLSIDRGFSSASDAAWSEIEKRGPDAQG